MRPLTMIVLLAATSACSTTSATSGASGTAPSAGRGPRPEGGGGRREAADRPLLPGRGIREPAAIRTVIGACAPAVSQCYERFLATHPGAEGRLVLIVEIAPSGDVNAADVADTTVPGLAGNSTCFTDVFRALQFGAAPGTTTIRWPYNFTIDADGTALGGSARPRSP